MKLRNFLILFFTVSIVKLHAQKQPEKCGTEILHQEKKTLYPELYKQQEEFKKLLTQKVMSKKALKSAAATTQVYSIPVVVHVIHNNSSGTTGGANNTNISDAQILSQIDVLNEDYRKKAGTPGDNTNPVGADTYIEFCLASSDPNGNYTNGITRTYYNKASWDYNSSDETILKSLSYWPSDQYLNLWVCKLNGGVLGYAQYPEGTPLQWPWGSPTTPASLDGVVIDFRAFGRTGAVVSPYNQGKTASHEIGHWLGLLHIWGDADCGDDYIADTPWDRAPNNDYDCLDSSDCANPAVYTQDLTADYMDYSVDACLNVFTLDQRDRMQTAIQTAPRRTSVVNSTGCCVKNVTSIPLKEGFEAGEENLWTEFHSNASNKWDTISPGYNSSYSLSFDNTLALSTDSNYVISPFLTLSNAHPAVKFDLAYAQGTSTGTDTLIISYSTDCYNWIPLVQYYGNDLISTNTIANNFVPASSSDWKEINLSLPTLNNKSVGRIRFESHSAQRNIVYLDDINIYLTSSTLVINPYPNPANNSIFVDVTISGYQNFTYELFDVLGQKIFSTKDYQQTSYTKELNLAGLNTGIYILKVSTDTKSATKKIFIE